ncbi:hypothetical protein CBM2623_A90049 [Cupriavidus taiwanensis]|nr:hypothetical protein CBM2608_A80048 [Cupriavidus taiwanensis]SPA31805.1 hypothetical protein CBM2623_A90049 [Cupriavidus taiwanensis]
MPCEPLPGAGRLPSHQGSGVAPDSGNRVCWGSLDAATPMRELPQGAGLRQLRDALSYAGRPAA